MSGRLPAMNEAYSRRMQFLLKNEYEAYRASFGLKPFRGYRINTLKIAEEEFFHTVNLPAGRTPFAENGFYLHGLSLTWKPDIMDIEKEGSRMAQDYIVLNTSTDNGMIAINKSVFESIAQISIKDIENASEVLSSAFTKPVQIKIVKNKLHVLADIKVRYGANVNATCELVQNKIYENILFMTGFKPSEVAVNVVGFEI